MYEKQWEFLENKFRANQLSHAYLLSGNNAKSIDSFVKDFVKFINCLNGKRQCVDCQNCKLLEKESFPDLLMLSSLKSESSLKDGVDKMEIDIAQVRESQNFLAFKPYCGNYKSVIIEDAERMNSEAQTCLLKTLEEPKGKTIVFLISTKPDMLLPTIFSRCQQIKFFTSQELNSFDAENEMLKEIIKVSKGDLAEKFAYAKNADLSGSNFNEMLLSLQKHFRQALISSIGAVGALSESSGNPASNSVSKIKKIIRLIERVSYQVNTTNANPKLALEVLLMEM